MKKYLLILPILCGLWRTHAIVPAKNEVWEQPKRYKTKRRVSDAVRREILGRKLNVNLQGDTQKRPNLKPPQESLRYLMDNGECPNCDLGGADLRDLKLKDYANFENSYLWGAWLNGFSAKYANWTNAVMNAVNSDPNPSTNPEPDLRKPHDKANFTGGWFMNTQLNSAIMPNTIFDEVKFIKAPPNKQIAGRAPGPQIHEVDMSNGSFKKAMLDTANFYFSRLNNANFRGSTSQNSEFGQADLSGANFTNRNSDAPVLSPSSMNAIPNSESFEDAFGNRIDKSTVLCGTTAPDGTMWFLPSDKGQCATANQAKEAIPVGTPGNTKVEYSVPQSAQGTVRTVREVRELTRGSGTYA